MLSDVNLKFCTYFKKLDEFKYKSETYDTYTAFCLKDGLFNYRIDDKQGVASGGDVIICPPNKTFYREIVESAELCMIVFELADDTVLESGKIKISDIIRFNEDMDKLVNCLYCNSFEEEKRFSHYCMDILYLVSDSIKDNSGLAPIKQYIEQNFDKEISIDLLAKNAGYTTPYLINKFKSYYGMPPKAYHSNIRLQRAKELLITTNMLSREIANAVGFSDDLYFIRFFKKHTGLTPKQFMKNKLL